MDSDGAKIEEVSTTEVAPAGYQTVNSHMDTKECKEWPECHTWNHTKKGLQFDLEIGTEKRERAIKDVRSHIDEIYGSLKEPADLVKLNTCKDALEDELNNFKAMHERDWSTYYIKVHW